jgi:hypothetical protein
MKAASKFVDTLFVNRKDEEAETVIRKILGTGHSILAAESHWRKRFAFDLGILLYRQEKWLEAECTFRDMLSIWPAPSPPVSSFGLTWDSERVGRRKVKGFPLVITLSDVLQELQYVLKQQGKDEEADNIDLELEEETQQSRPPIIWEDID